MQHHSTDASDEPALPTSTNLESSMPLRPLSRLELGSELNGAFGINRANPERLQITATNDIDAIGCFLAEFESSPGTHRIYQRECERLLLWSVTQCGKPLSSLNRTDFERYLEFLADPQPRSRWCGPRSARDGENWRPFVGPLSRSAMMTTAAAVNSLFKWLCDAGYLNGNPLGLIRMGLRKAHTSSHNATTRYLDADMWQAVTRAIESLPRKDLAEQAAYERARFLCMFLYALAPRAGELESHTMGSFVEVRGRWWWEVLGKGLKDAKVPVPDDMVKALFRYRRFLQLPLRPTLGENTPLLLSVRTMKSTLASNINALRQQEVVNTGLVMKSRPAKAASATLASLQRAPAMTARQLNRVLKVLFDRAAALLPAELEHKADKLRCASAHWGRHTSITAKVDAGMDARYVQKDARHEDARTTALYTHEDDIRWHQEAQKLRVVWPDEDTPGPT